MKYLIGLIFILGFSTSAMGEPPSLATKSNQWPNDPFYLPIDSTFVGPVDFARASKVQSQLQNIYAGEFNFIG